MRSCRWLGHTALAALAFAAAPAYALLASAVDIYFGTTGSVQTVSQAVFVTNDTPFVVKLTGFNIVGGGTPKDFDVAASSTCAKDTTLDPGERCRFDLEFTPSGDGDRDSNLKIFTDIDLDPLAITLSGTGIKVTAAKETYPALLGDPPFVEFGARAAGATTAFARYVVRNAGTASIRVESFGLIGRSPNDFALGDATCGNPSKLGPGETCYIDVRFQPRSDGVATVQLRVKLVGGDRFFATFIGNGGVAPGGRVEVVEFYNAGFDHYFVSSLIPDIVANDTGANAGWTRTGRTFPAFPVDPASLVAKAGGATPVCRYYIPPQLGNSHFYSASPAECAEVGAKFPAFTFEAPNVMYAFLPDLVSGACPASSVAVYRVWNQRADSNHRYSTDIGVRAAMLAKGYIAEGYGPDGVAMCAPI